MNDSRSDMKESPIHKLSHTDLVDRAERWLRGTKQCKPVFIEVGSGAMEACEFPDAMGFGPHSSIVVECKSSRSDFLSDKRKPHREYPDLAMGNARYYMCEPSVINESELIRNGMGLLYVYRRKVKVIKESRFFQSNLNAERRYMRSRLLPYDYHEETPLGKRARDVIKLIAPCLKTWLEDLIEGDKYYDIFNEVIAVDEEYKSFEENEIRIT